MDRTSREQQMYGSGVASLIGDSGISLDGQSIQLPEDGGYDIQDDISSIHDASYYRGVAPGYRDPSPRIKIVGTASSMEEGDVNMEVLTPASMTMSDKVDPKQNNDQGTMASTLDAGKPAPNMRNTSRISVDGSDDGKGGCFPKWISSAPRWLKFGMAFSAASLVGAVVLVTVALSQALVNRNESAPTTNFITFAPGVVAPQAPTSPGVLNAPAPTPTPIFDTESDAPPSATSETKTDPPVAAEAVAVTTDFPTPAPSSKPQEETVAEFLPETAPPTAGEPAVAQQGQSQSKPQEDNSLVPQEDTASIPYDPFVTTFFVTGGRFTNEALEQVPEQLRTLPVRGGTSFLVHLGDWNSPYATKCDRQSYKDVDDLFSNSSIPVYFVPGDNDFNDCPDPEQAMGFWHEHLLDYETHHWKEPSQWAVARGAADLYPENFAFVYNEILFVGINLVGGVVHNATEWITRQNANLEWIDANYQQHKDSLKAFVLFAHADPDVPSNSPFYEPFKDRVKQEYNKVPVVLIHRNLGVEPWSWETEFENIDNFSVIVVAGSQWPPLMGAVDFRQDNPFVFDQGNWYGEYIEHQTNNAPV